jgi:hypothetical protein
MAMRLGHSVEIRAANRRQRCLCRNARATASNARVYGRGRGVGRVLGIGLLRGVGVGRGVAVGVEVGVAVAVGVGVGLPLPAGAWIATVIGNPVLKKSTMAFVACGG